MALNLRPTSHRLEGFSDAVFAIVVTIMMVEIHVPDQFAQLNPNSPEMQDFGVLLLAYAISYLVIMTLWISHHYLTLIIPHVDRSLIWLNSLMLFFVSFIPMASGFLGRNPTSSNAGALFSLLLFLCTAAFGLIRWHASRVCEHVDHRDIHLQVLRKIAFTLVVYAFALPIAYFDMRLAWLCFVVTPLMFSFPVVRASRRLHRSRSRA